jgi:Flp pilus assembly protein TadG
MNGHRSSWAGHRRGVAAVEFAIIAPVLLMLLGGITDFGLVMFGKSQLANGLAQGVQYALLQGASVTAANITTAVQNGASRAGLAPTVTVTVTGPACYCVTGTPAALVTPSTALSGSSTCTGTCPTPEMAPGAFVTVAASFVYVPLMPFYSKLATTTVSETVTVRLQ